MPRLFIAIEPPDEIKQSLNRVSQSLQWPHQVRPVPPENIHLTLHFFSDVAEEYVPTIRSTMDEVLAKHPQLHLQVAQVGCFPTVKRPRVIWAGVQGEIANLASLQTELVQTLTGVEPENNFKPHLTLGRVKQPMPLIQLANAFRGVEFGTWDVEEVFLVSSELTHQGAKYEKLHRVALR